MMRRDLKADTISPSPFSFITRILKVDHFKFMHITNKYKQKNQNKKKKHNKNIDILQIADVKIISILFHNQIHIILFMRIRNILFGFRFKIAHSKPI